MTTSPIPRTALYVLSLAHLLHDVFTGTWLLVLAAQADWLDLSYTQVGLAAAAFTIASAVTQPWFGSAFDKNGKPYLAIWAVSWTTLSILAAGLAPYYGLVLISAWSAGMGTAAFHAAGLSSSSLLSAGRGAGRSTAIFLLGGNGGYALGAYVSGVLLEAHGASALIFFALPMILSTPFLIWRLKPYLSNHANQPQRTSREVMQGGGKVWLPIVAFTLITFARESVRGGYSTYLPQFYESIGSNLEYAGRYTSIFLFCAALSSFFGGIFSDRFPRRTLGALSFMLIAPLSFALLRSDGAVLGMLSILLGLTVNISLPIMLIIGQEILPGGKNAAGGFAFGITFAVRSVSEILIGPIADQIGLQDTMSLVGFLPLLFIGFYYLLPDRPQPVMLVEAQLASAD